MKIDWQAYDAGLLSPEAAESARKLLAESADARAELEGLRRLRGALLATASVEHIPVERMFNRVTNPAPKSPPKKLTWVLAAAAMLIVALALVAILVQNKRASEPSWQTLMGSDPHIIADFVKTKTNFKMGLVDPGPVALLHSVACLDNNVKYQIDIQGKRAELRIKWAKLVPLMGERIVTQRAEFYVTTDSNGVAIAWRSGKLEWKVVAPDQDSGLKLAETIEENTATWAQEDK